MNAIGRWAKQETQKLVSAIEETIDTYIDREIDNSDIQSAILEAIDNMQDITRARGMIERAWQLMAVIVDVRRKFIASGTEMNDRKNAIIAIAHTAYKQGYL